MRLGAEVLRGVEALRALGEGALQELAEAAILRRYAAGTWITGERDGDGTIAVMVEGTAQLVLYSPDDREIVTGTFGPGEIVGLTLVSGSARRGVLRATQAATVYHLQARVLRQVMASHPDFAMDIFDVVARRLVMADAMVEALALQDVPTRLAECLAARAGADPERTVHLTQQELAALVATRREYVNRLLVQLQRRGLVRCPSRGQIVVPDPPRLVSAVSSLA